jgi:hypothetical protein
MSRPLKVSHPLANLANMIEEHVTHTWPEIARTAPPDVWFTGSHIWHFLYPELSQREPPLIRDWDIFTIEDATAQWIIGVYGWNRRPSCRTSDKWGRAPRIIDVTRIPVLQTRTPRGGISVSGYGDGYSYQTDRGIVDLWISDLGSPLAELKAYPTVSHAHCRAAWSFTDGLIVLPNEHARREQTGNLQP